MIGTGAVVQKLKEASHPSKHISISEGEFVDNTEALSWNPLAILCRDGSSGFQKGIYNGSGSSDGASRGFWWMDWDTLNLSCRYGTSDSYVSWPFRPVSSSARLKRRNREPPVRLTINIEGYPREIAVQLIKQRIYDWLNENSSKESREFELAIALDARAEILVPLMMTEGQKLKTGDWAFLRRGNQPKGSKFEA